MVVNSKRALQRLKDLLQAGSFATACAVEARTGDLRDPDMRALFSTLPVITPATSPEELVEHGLLLAAPRHLNEALARPRYFPGREVFVPAELNYRGRSHKAMGAYDKEGIHGISHLGILLGRKGEQFVVELAGREEPLSISPGDIFSYNEPCGLPAAGGTLSGVHVDFSDPLWRAHVCAGYMQISSQLQQLDFSQEKETFQKIQEHLIYTLAARIRMNFLGRGEGFAGNKGSALLLGGQGVCFVQRTVAAAYLQCFSRTLGFDVQHAVGKTLSRELPRGFVIITLRPAMARFVCDPAWSEPLTDLRVAFFDAGWGHDRRVIGFEGQLAPYPPASAVALSEIT